MNRGGLDMLSFVFFMLFIIIFIAGMTILRTGLFNLSANKLRFWLAKLTDRPWKGLIAGAIITVILQSSSAVMVITIGLISARIISFPASIGIILGTNIGTTVTTEIITFQIDSILVALVIVGAFLSLWSHKNVRSIGFILFGIAAVFISMNGFKHLAYPLTTIPLIEEFIQLMNESHLSSVVVGTIVTGIIQSSTALIGIVMGFLSSGMMQLNTGIALMLGANIGTCVTAYLASIGAGKDAKLCAYAHIWLNVLGVILFFPFIDHLAYYVALTTNKIDVQLAHSSVIFNVLSSLVVLPFAHSFGNFILTIHTKRR